MNLVQLYDILRVTTELDSSEKHPHAPTMGPHSVRKLSADIMLVDYHSVAVVVKMANARLRREQLTALLEQWPMRAGGQTVRQLRGKDEEVMFKDAQIVLDQDEAGVWCLFALLRALGLCELVTPFDRGIEDCRQITNLAGTGAFAIKNYNPNGWAESGPHTPAPQVPAQRP